MWDWVFGRVGRGSTGVVEVYGLGRFVLGKSFDLVVFLFFVMNGGIILLIL